VNRDTVLVVEDNEISRKLACTLLDLRGYDTLAAGTVAAAVDLAVEHRPVLILMDIQLPDQDGVAALAKLRADARTAAIPVIALTAYAMAGDRERLLSKGFDAYLSKPIDVRSFVDDIAKLIAGDGVT
jgi:two-component system, cell cycle response regulator DivK